MENLAKKGEQQKEVKTESIAQVLDAQDLELISDRQKLSSGFCGSIYLLEVKDKKTGETFQIVEKTFTFGGPTDAGKPGKRYWVEDVELPAYVQDSRPRLGLVDKETGQVNQVIVDWVYNEERALKDLAEIPGIPKSYGPVYEGVRGSILEEFIKGCEIFSLLGNVQIQSEEEIREILAKVKKTYVQAAEKGYIYNNPAGSAILVDEKTKNPYLIDWYNHSLGSIDSEGPAKEKFEQGFRDLQKLEEYLIREFQAKKKKTFNSSLLVK